MYKKFKKMNYLKQIFFALLIGIAVVSFWRGVWGLLDLYLLPDNIELSFWISTVMGIVILTITGYAVKELT